MSHKVRRIAYLMKHEVEGVEFGLDRQIADAARFLATVCEARVELSTCAALPHEAIVCAGELIGLHVASRSKLMELHDKLGVIAGKLDVKELAAVPGGPKVPPSTAYVAEAEAVAQPAIAA